MPLDEDDVMSNGQSQATDREEQDIARLLRAAGRREELPQALKERWEERFREELKPRQKRRHHLRYFAVGIAAGIVALGVATILSLPNTHVSPRTISVASISGGVHLMNSDEGKEELRVGQHLSTGAKLRTGPRGFVAVRHGGYDLRLHNGSTVSLHYNSITVDAGEVYVSNEDSDPEEGKIKVLTRYGEIEDIGTQFTVRVDQDRVVSTVRRGAVLVTTPSEEYRAEAQSETARQIIFNDQQLLDISDHPPTGPAWEWIYQSSLDYKLEGQSVFDFLQWSSGETGAQIQYATQSAEIYARVTLLHGDLNGLNPDEAIEPVLASTHLRVERRGDRHLRITLPPR